MEKMPRMTGARVARVQKKSLERKALKNARRGGRRRPAITLMDPATAKMATAGQRSAPSGTRRSARSAMTAMTKVAAQMMAAALGGVACPGAGAPRQVGGSLRAGAPLRARVLRRLFRHDAAPSLLLRPPLTGAVRVGLPNDLAVTRLPEVLGDFGVANPGIRLEVVCDISTSLLRGLQEGRDQLLQAEA